MRLDMEISKKGVLLANTHNSDQKKYYKRFLYTFALYIIGHTKTTMSIECHRM